VTAGTHTFKWVYSKDSAGSVGFDTAWIDDIVFPVQIPATVTISSPLAGVTKNNRPMLGYGVSGGTVVVKVDGSVVGKVSGNTLDALSDGPHTVRVEATNSSGTGFAEIPFTVDTLAPALAIDPVTNPTATASQTISGTRESNAAIGVTVNTVATVDAVTYPTATTWSCNLRGLVSGANTVTVTATDIANNSASSTVTIRYGNGALVLQSAYDAAADGSSIMLRAGDLFEDPILGRDIKVWIGGGYDIPYQSVIGATMVHGKITVSEGTVSLGNIVLR